MIRITLISLAVAFLAAMLSYLAIVVSAPTMYVEKAINILAIVFATVAVVTSLVLLRRQG